MYLKSSELRNRPGVTLLEALVAVGIMSIGLIALLTFFPLAAVQMAHSFKDDRVASLAANADNFMAVGWREIWFDANTDGQRRSDYNVMYDREPALMAMDDPSVRASFASPADPNGYNNWYNSQNIIAMRNSDAPSYPVLIDPVSWRTRTPGSTDQLWVGFQNSVVTTGASRNYLARRTFSGTVFNTSNNALVSRLCALLDDISFGENGQPDVSTGRVERAGKYNCAWMLQRPRNKNRYEVNVQLLTFQSRPTTDITSFEESAAVTSGATGFTGIQIFFNQPSLPVYKGEWIIACDQSSRPATLDSLRNISFHRVLSITPDEASPGNFSIELQQPLTFNATQIIMMQGLVEVFDLGKVTLTSSPKP